MPAISNKVLERLFQAGAGALMLVAGYYFWQADYDRVFLLAALGSLSFFIGIRFQVQQRLETREAEKERVEIAKMNGAFASSTPPGIEDESLKDDRREYS